MVLRGKVLEAPDGSAWTFRITVDAANPQSSDSLLAEHKEFIDGTYGRSDIVGEAFNANDTHMEVLAADVWHAHWVAQGVSGVSNPVLAGYDYRIVFTPRPSPPGLSRVGDS